MIKKAFLIIAGIILFVYLFVSMNFNPNLLIQVKNPGYIIVSLFLFLSSIVIIALRTSFFIKSIGEKSCSLLKLVKIEFIGKFFYYVFPTRLNVPAKAVLLSKESGISKGNAISITTFEYALDVGIMFILGLLGLSIFFQNFFDEITLNKIIYSVILLFVVVLVFFIIPKSFFKKCLAKLEKVKASLFRKVLLFSWKIIVKIRETWPKMLLNKQTFPVVFILILNWILVALSTEFIFLAYYDYVPFLWVLTVSVVAVLIGGISQIPGGLGLKEITLVLLFTFLGVPEQIALTSALLSRIFTIIPIMVGYYFLIEFGGKNKINDLFK